MGPIHYSLFPIVSLNFGHGFWRRGLAIILNGDTVDAVEVLWLKGSPFSIIKASDRFDLKCKETRIWLEASCSLCVEVWTSTELNKIERTSKS